MDGVHTRARDVLERQVAHVLRLVDDLLDVSRITTGKVELRVEPIEVAAAIQRALEMSRPLLEQKRNHVVVEVAERGLVVDADPARLAQIFANLVTNASKYSDPDTTIRVRAGGDGETVRVAVTDQGIGIDPAYAERIAVTGYGQADDRERTRVAGFHAHLVKPVSIANVNKAISDLLTDSSERD